MLPPGFEWRHYIDAPALYLDGKQVAILSPIENGCRAVLQPQSKDLRYRFFRSEAAAIEHLERWASTWEARLRDG